MLRRFPRSTTGQASVEYAGALAVVAVVIGAVAVVTAKHDLATPVANALKDAVCRVTGAICVGDGREPCRLRSRQDAEEVAAWMVVELRYGGQLIVEQFSDGTAAVGFTDSGSSGVAYGYGVSLGRVGEAGLEASGGVRFTAGRRWRFPDRAAAERFVARYAERESVRGEVEAAGRSVCRWLRACREAAPRPVDPDERWHAGGVYGRGDADLAIAAARPQPIAGATLELAGTRTLGRRVDRRTGEHTYFFRVEDSAAAALGAVVGALSVAPGYEVVAEYTQSRTGEPLRLRLTGMAAVRFGGALGRQLDLPGISRQLRRSAQLATSAGKEHGDLVEASVEVDLRDPGVAASGRRFLAALNPVHAAHLPVEAARLASALDRHGRVELRTYSTRRDSAESELAVTSGVKVGGAATTSGERQELTGAWTRDPGDVLLDREDCLVVT